MPAVARHGASTHLANLAVLDVLKHREPAGGPAACTHRERKNHRKGRAVRAQNTQLSSTERKSHPHPVTMHCGTSSLLLWCKVRVDPPQYTTGKVWR